MSRFDRFMVHVDVGTDEKLAQLTDVERLCHIAGVLAVAAKSPVRGRLLVGDREATPREIAKRADVSVRVARSTMDKLIDVGVLTRDDDLDCWRVHNWERFNPDPKQDRTNAERQARYRAKRVTGRNAPSNAPRNGQSNGSVTPPEVEVEVEAAASPVGGGSSAGAREAAGVAAAADSDQGQEEGTPGGLHPAFAEVMTILEATRSERPGVVVNDFAVNSALMAHRKVDAVSAAHTAAARIAEGTSNTDVATVPLRWALRDAANGEQPSGQRKGAPRRGETPDVVSGRGASSALTRAMARDREQAEMRRRRAEQTEADRGAS